MAIYKGTKRYQLLTTLSNAKDPLTDSDLALTLGWDRKSATDCRFHMYSAGYVNKGTPKPDGSLTWTISIPGLRALRDAVEPEDNSATESTKVVHRGKRRRGKALSPSVARKKALLLKVFLEAHRPLSDSELVVASGLPKHEVLRYRLNLVNEGLVVRFGYRPGRDRTRKPLHLWCHVDRKGELEAAKEVVSNSSCSLSLDDGQSKAELIQDILSLSSSLARTRNLAKLVITLGDLKTTQESLSGLVKSIHEFQSHVTLDTLEQLAVHSQIKQS